MTEGARILCVINSLEGGGAERVFVQVIQALVGAAWAPRLEVVLLDEAPRRYAPPAGAGLVQLDARASLARSAAGVLARARAFKPDLIVSFLTRANCASILAGAMAGAPVLLSERVNTREHLGPGGGLRHGLVRVLYPRARRVVAVSQGVGETLAACYGVPRAKVSVIPNPVDASALQAAAAAEPEFALPTRFLAAVGRLTPAKNFPLLLRAFARSNCFPHLVILGEGPERARLQALAQGLGLGGRVHLPGFAANPHAVVARAAGYASASNAEGFPNALVEAMALGVPVLAADCPSGPAEILDRPADAAQGLLQLPAGLLAPMQDEEAFAQGLRRLSRPAIAEVLARGGRERIRAYAPQRVFAAYERAVLTALPSHRQPVLLGAPPCVSA